MKPKVLAILHLPPPVHGAAMVGDYVKSSKVVNSLLNIHYINLGTSVSVDDIGKKRISKLLRYIRLLLWVIVNMINFRPQKVYMTLTAKGNGFYKDALVVVLAKILGGKMVYHFHNKGVCTQQHKPFDNWLYKRVFKNAEVILLSEYLYPDVQKYVSRERVYICPNGIPDQITAEKKQPIKTGNEPVQLLFLSNLIESKGIFVLLEACTILKQKGVSFGCVIVGGEGDITEKQLNEQIARAGLENEVHYAGKKYGEEKEAVFVASDIFVHPSYNDCFPLVLLEAMQFKLPIVTTPEGGIPSLVEQGENGFLVKQKDAKVCANQLEKLINNPQKRKEMGLKSYEKYQGAFTLQAFEARITEILRDKISGV